MSRAPSTPPTDDRGTRVALVFALAAERLSAWYEHGRWLTESEGAGLAAEWLARSKRASLPLVARRRLSALGDRLARQIADSLSREAGLYAAHEMMEALDPRHHSELALSLMKECERLVEADDAGR